MSLAMFCDAKIDCFYSNDALRKHGILPPKDPPPPSPSPPPSPTLEEVLNEFDLAELRELGEDAPDADTERFIGKYRRQRIANDKKDQRRARFGRVYPIGRDDYTREVTEASNLDEDGDDDRKGTGVICFLYKDGYVLVVDKSLDMIKRLKIVGQTTTKRSCLPTYAYTRTTISTNKICFHRREQVHS